MLRPKWPNICVNTSFLCFQKKCSPGIWNIFLGVNEGIFALIILKLATMMKRLWPSKWAFVVIVTAPVIGYGFHVVQELAMQEHCTPSFIALLDKEIGQRIQILTYRFTILHNRDTDTAEKCFAHYRFQNIQTRSWKPTWPALVIPYGSRTAAGLWVAFKCGPLNKSNLPLWAWAMAGFDHSWPSELVLNRTSFWWSMWPAEINSGLVAMIIVMLVVNGGDGGDVAVWSYLVLLMGHKNITETSDQVVCGYAACYTWTLNK